jgi:glycosyltransferase 2 family protein
MTRRSRIPVTDPSVRLALGIAGFALARVAVHREDVGPLELRIFRAVNHLPDGLRGPLWLVMQTGTLAAAPLAAFVATASGHPRLARRLLAGGVTTWTLSKLVKQRVRRPRPTTLLADTRPRGQLQSGLGFVSGHAGVATGLCAAAFPELGPGGRRLAIATAATVALSRLYVGAHLPLDVVGGAALGLAVDAALDLHDRADAGAGRWCARRVWTCGQPPLGPPS